jgi:hypothetical protein
MLCYILIQYSNDDRYIIGGFSSLTHAINHNKKQTSRPFYEDRYTNSIEVWDCDKKVETYLYNWKLKDFVLTS